MSFSEDIKKPFNIITLTIAIISIGLTIYFYVEGIKEKSICYKIEHNPSLIFDNEKISPNIRVLEKDSIIIAENIYMIKGMIWNDGDLPIEDKDIKRKIVIRLENINRIIDFKIEKQTDKENKNFQINKIDSISLNLSWEYFEPQDGLTFQIIYIGNPQPLFKVEGKIIGIKDIKENNASDDNGISLLELIVIVLFASILTSFIEKITSKVIEKCYSLKIAENVPINIREFLSKIDTISSKYNIILKVIISIILVILLITLILLKNSPPNELL